MLNTTSAVADVKQWEIENAVKCFSVFIDLVRFATDFTWKINA